MNKTAIILFADLPDFEARAKSLSSYASKKATTKISTVLTKHFYELAKQSTAEVCLIDSRQQKGKTFGRRISNAFADVFNKGFENIICIGNDCPDLSLETLESAIQKVEAGNIVLGPTFDGGAYLIGIPKERFNQLRFEQISWQSKQTFHDLKTLFPDTLIELPLLADIDHASDLSISGNYHPLIKCLINIIKSFYPTRTSKINIPQFLSFSVDSAFLKGPPISLLGESRF